VDAHVVRSEAVVLRDARAAEPSATSWIPVSLRPPRRPPVVHPARSCRQDCLARTSSPEIAPPRSAQTPMPALQLPCAVRSCASAAPGSAAARKFDIRLIENPGCGWSQPSSSA